MESDTKNDLTILALDLGTKMGWAFKDKDYIILSGTDEFRPSRHEGGGMRYLRFRQWLTEMKNLAEDKDIDVIYYEEVAARQPSVAADHTYGGFTATLTAWCEHFDVPYLGVPVGTIKKFATGKGNCNKAAMIESCVNNYGINPKDDNEADALHLLHYALTRNKE